MGVAITVNVHERAAFYEVPVGKKVIVGVTGLVLIGYVVAHMLGNLQIFLGREQINAYAELLHRSGPLLWAVRVVLLVSVGLHMLLTLQLWLLKRRARPVRYVKKIDVPTAYAARTMILSGPLIAAFVIFHLLHLTTGQAGLPFEPLNVYDNVVRGFRIWYVSLAYMVAVSLVGVHVWHGLWSMLHTLGLDDERYRPALRFISHAVGLLTALGFLSIPVAVLTGLIGGGVN
ncbi:MAG: succinate dehydrogenase cytochrome b subunit [Bryobacteraceae bacterium]